MYLLYVLNYLLNNPFSPPGLHTAPSSYLHWKLLRFFFPPSSDCPWAVLITVVLEYILGSHMARLPQYAYFNIFPGFLSCEPQNYFGRAS